jgi:hypothetical protein
MAARKMEADAMFGGMLRCWKNAADGTHHIICTHATPHPTLTDEDIELIPKYTHIPAEVIVPVLYKKMIESVHAFHSCGCKGDCAESFLELVRREADRSKVFRTIFRSARPFVDVRMSVTLDESTEDCDTFAKALRMSDKRTEVCFPAFIKHAKASIRIVQGDELVLRVGCSFVEFDLLGEMITLKGSGDIELWNVSKTLLCTIRDDDDIKKEDAIVQMKEIISGSGIEK